MVNKESIFDITVELFGIPRMSCKTNSVKLEVSADHELKDVINDLSDYFPQLVGVAIQDNRSALLDSYVFNLNGKQFLSDGALNLQAGDRILLFSSLAGG